MSAKAEKSLRFAKNFGWSLAGQIASAFINFLILPFIIHRLGTEAYGLYIIMNVATSYLMLATLGSGAPTIRYAASALGAGDGEAAGRIQRLSLAFHLTGTVLGAAVLGILAPQVAFRVFHVPQAMVPVGAFLLRAAAVAAVLFATSRAYQSMVQGGQRFGRLSVIAFVQAGITPLGLAALLLAGRGLRAFAIWYVLVNAAACVLAAWAARATIREASRGGRSETPALWEFFTWSLRSWLGPLAWVVINQVDKVVIARAMSLTAVTLYAVPAGLLQRLQLVPGAASAVIVPMMSELQGEGSEEPVRRMYLKGTRFVLWTMLPVLVVLFVFMPQFLGLWLHGDFASRSVWPSRVLVLVQLFFLAYVMPNTAALSRDRPGYTSAITWAQAILSLVFWRLLVHRYGLLGVALGSLLAQGLPSVFYLFHVHRLLGVPAKRFVSEGLWRPAVSGVLMSAALYPFHAQASSWPRLIGLAAAGCALFYGSTWLLITPEDKELALHALERAPLLGALLERRGVGE